MAIKLLLLMLFQFTYFAHSNTTTTRPIAPPPCNTDQLEYRLTRLEVQVGEKSNLINAELREGNRRLNALEAQTSEVQTTLQSFRDELHRFSETQSTARLPPQRNQRSNNLETKIENLNRGVQVLISAVRVLNSDVGMIRKNLSDIETRTKLMLIKHNDLVTKPFLSNSLVDVKHHQQQQQQQIHHRRHEETLAKNCKEILDRGNNISGIYRIQPALAPRAFMVLCDMQTKQGGWTFIHNRYDGSQDFYLDWHSYKVGFGNLGGEFWLGLDYIHQLTGDHVNELLIELVDATSKKVTAHYAAFSLGDEIEGYALKVLAGYGGDAGDSLIYHAGSKFSTRDMDQDNWPEGSCAQSHHGAWWYRGCDTCNLNGQYLTGDLPEEYTNKGMYWADFHGAQYSLMQARMMVRPRVEGAGPIVPENFQNLP